MLRKRREIILVVALAALIVIAGRFFATDTEPSRPAPTPNAEVTNQAPEPADRTGAATRLELRGDVPSEPIRVGSNQCLQWWGRTPRAYRVEVAGFAGDDWQPNEAFLAARQAGIADYNFPAWYRFVGVTEGVTEISHRILRGLC
tara:strand:- start:10 stop:444 length:435 start_codon:yes stop_codon:yes gene_type:complete